MDNPAISTEEEFDLRSLGRRRLPASLVADLRLLLDLPAETRERLWTVLGPSLAETAPPSYKRDFEAFEREFALQAHTLVRIIGAYRGIIVLAALQGSDGTALAADLHLLTRSEEPGRLLKQHYDSAATMVRREAIRATLAEHGPLLDAFEWRVDHVAASSRPDGLRFGFGVLTLKYQDQGQSKRLTLQLAPDAVGDLAAAFATMTARPTIPVAQK
jgi:hypothetical protein